MSEDVRAFKPFKMVALKEKNEILVGDEGDVEVWLSSNVALPLFRLTSGKHRLAKRTVCGKRQHGRGADDYRGWAGLENQLLAPVEVKPPWGLELKDEEAHVNYRKSSKSTEEQDDTSKPGQSYAPFWLDNKVRGNDIAHIMLSFLMCFLCLRRFDALPSQPTMRRGF